MARKVKESVSETKHIVEENAIDAPVKDIHWEASQIDTESETHLEDDEGYGGVAVVRMFEFSKNPQSFRDHPPTKQELFNSHLKGIEVMLWKDGLQIMPEVEPRVGVGKKKYRIFVGAEPARGHMLPWNVKPQKLGEITHGRN